MDVPSTLLFVHISSLLPWGAFQEMEFLDITSIRDTRFGKFAKIPKVSGPGSSPGAAWPPPPWDQGRSLSGGGKPDLWNKVKGPWAGQQGLILR